METFSALLAICAGNSPVSGEFPAQRPVTQSFDVFFDVRVWVNTREAGDLRRYRIHYDVIVMNFAHFVLPSPYFVFLLGRGMALASFVTGSWYTFLWGRSHWRSVDTDCRSLCFAGTVSCFVLVCNALVLVKFVNIVRCRYNATSFLKKIFAKDK